jgi:hypothetical protein
MPPCCPGLRYHPRSGSRESDSRKDDDRHNDHGERAVEPVHEATSCGDICRAHSIAQSRLGGSFSRNSRAASRKRRPLLANWWGIAAGIANGIWPARRTSGCTGQSTLALALLLVVRGQFRRTVDRSAPPPRFDQPRCTCRPTDTTETH